jgi:hypothetical protein
VRPAIEALHVVLAQQCESASEFRQRFFAKDERAIWIGPASHGDRLSYFALYSLLCARIELASQTDQLRAASSHAREGLWSTHRRRWASYVCHDDFVLGCPKTAWMQIGGS